MSLRRQAGAGALTAGLVWLFSLGRADLAAVHVWNRSLADAAFVLLCLTLVLGPLARLFPGWPRLLPWRRELGLWCALAAGGHVAVYALGALGGNALAFFSAETHHAGVELLRNAFAIANWIGLAALLFLVGLTLTSNDFSQRLLRWSGWKFLQQQTYTLFVLTLLHTGAFLYAIILTDRGMFPPVYWLGLLVTAGLQLAGFVGTVRRQRARRPEA